MKELILTLLFAKELLLTPVPVSFKGPLTIVPEKPISAITKGAALEIDVTPMLPVRAGSLFKYWEMGAFKREFPPGAIRAALVEKDGRTIALQYDGQAAVSNGRLWLMLSYDQAMPTDAKFVKINVFSEVSLKDVRIYWKNYGK